MKEQTTRAAELSTQITGVATAQHEAEQRAHTFEQRQEHNQQQLMGMLAGLTQLATGGRPALAASPGGGGGPSFSFSTQQSFLTAAEMGSSEAYGPSALGNGALPAPYSKASSPPPPPGAGGGAGSF